MSSLHKVAFFEPSLLSHGNSLSSCLLSILQSSVIVDALLLPNALGNTIYCSEFIVTGLAILIAPIPANPGLLFDLCISFATVLIPFFAADFSTASPPFFKAYWSACLVRW